MERQPHISGEIVSIGYDHPSETLDIEYADGSIYRYLMVPQFTYRAMMSAPSASDFAEAHLKPGPYARGRLADDAG